MASASASSSSAGQKRRAEDDKKPTTAAEPARKRTAAAPPLSTAARLTNKRQAAVPVVATQQDQDLPPMCEGCHNDCDEDEEPINLAVPYPLTTIDCEQKQLCSECSEDLIQTKECFPLEQARRVLWPLVSEDNGSGGTTLQPIGMPFTISHILFLREFLSPGAMLPLIWKNPSRPHADVQIGGHTNPFRPTVCIGQESTSIGMLAACLWEGYGDMTDPRGIAFINRPYHNLTPFYDVDAISANLHSMWNRYITLQSVMLRRDAAFPKVLITLIVAHLENLMFVDDYLPEVPTGGEGSELEPIPVVPRAPNPHASSPRSRCIMKECSDSSREQDGTSKLSLSTSSFIIGNSPDGETDIRALVHAKSRVLSLQPIAGTGHSNSTASTRPDATASGSIKANAKTAIRIRDYNIAAARKRAEQLLAALVWKI